MLFLLCGVFASGCVTLDEIFTYPIQQPSSWCYAVIASSCGQISGIFPNQQRWCCENPALHLNFRSDNSTPLVVTQNGKTTTIPADEFYQRYYARISCGYVGYAFTIVCATKPLSYINDYSQWKRCYL